MAIGWVSSIESLPMVNEMVDSSIAEEVSVVLGVDMITAFLFAAVTEDG